MAVYSVLITNIFEPLEHKNRVVAVDEWEGKPLSSMIPIHYEVVVNLNGVNVTDMSIIPADEAQIIMAPVLEGESEGSKNIVRMVAIIAIAVYAPYLAQGFMGATAGMVGAGMYGGMMGAAIYAGIQIGVVVAGSMLVNALLPPQSPDAATPAIAGVESSPTYSWEGMRTLARIGSPIPVLYGTHAIAGNLISRRVSYDGSDEFLYMLIALCEGEIQALSESNIKLNGMDISTYSDVRVLSRPGGIVQSPMIYFGETVIANGFSVLCEYNIEQVKQSLGTGIEGLNLYIVFPQGLFGTNATTGALTTKTVTFSIEYRAVGDVTWITLPNYSSATLLGYEYKWQRCNDIDEYGWTINENLYPDYCDLVTFETAYTMTGERRELYDTDYELTWSISGASNTAIKRNIRIDNLAVDQYEARVVRLTPDDIEVSENTLMYWGGIGEIIYDELYYPGIALLGIKIKATGQLSGGDPTLTTIATRIPTPIYDDNGVFVKDGDLGNPAWAAWDILTNQRYGAKLAYSQIDFAAFVDWADWCDEVVYNGLISGGERRARFNGVIDFQTNVWDALAKVCTVGRAGMVIRGTKYSVIPDKPSLPVQLFSMGNIVESSFKTTYVGTEDLGTEVEVQFTNRENNYTKDQLSVIIPELVDQSLDTNRATISSLGTTSASQAYRMGKYLLLCNKYLRRSIEFEAGVDSIGCTVGDVIYFAHDVPLWGISGRIVSGTTDTVTLDQPVTLVAGTSYVVIIRISADDTFETRTVSFAGDQTVSTINLTSPFTAIPSEFDVFTFGETGKEKQLFRVYDISRKSDQTRKIRAIDYNESILTDTDVILPTPSASSFDEHIHVVNLVATERLEKKSDGTVIPYIDVEWGVDVDYAQSARFNILVSHDAGASYAPVITTKLTNYVMNGLDLTEGKSYLIKVQVEFMTMVEPLVSATEVSVIYQGKSSPPEDVLGFTTTLSQEQSGVVLTWDANTDVDLSSYYITLDGVKLIEGYKGTSYLAPLPSATTVHTYGIRAVDTSGNLSVTEVTQPFSFAVPPTLTLSTSIIEESVYISWDTPSSAIAIDYYSVKYDTLEISMKSTTFALPINWIGDKTFTVQAVDINGNIGLVASTIVTITGGTMLSLLAEIIDNNVLLKWEGSAGTLPIANYEVRKGDVFASATVIGEKKGTFTSVFESAADTYTYWVVPIDSAKNYGTERSISTYVSSPPDYILHVDYTSDFATGTLSNGFFDENADLLFGINGTETYSDHFFDNSFASPQAQVDAGYPLWLSPFETLGSYTEDFDYGIVLASTVITMTPTIVYGGLGNVTPIPNIQVSLNNIDWTDLGATWSVFASNFRYVRLKVSFAADDKSFANFQQLDVKLSSKQVNDAGSVNALSTDTGGTTVTFVTPFVDITSITLSVNSTTPLTAVYDFTDVPNPTTFKVLVFNDVGARVTADVSWSAKGY